MEKMTQAIANPTAVKRETDGGEDTKKRGWQERLEKLKQKKAEDKARQKMEEEAKKVQPKTEEEKVRESFAAASGIQRTNDGNL